MASENHSQSHGNSDGSDTDKASTASLVHASHVSESGDGAVIVTGIPDVPVTEERTPYRNSTSEKRIIDPGTARANLAATPEAPQGTTSENNWAARHQHLTVLQQHLAFFDPDRDGTIYPSDTYRGFYALGFGILLSLLAALIIHSNFSYPTLPPGHVLPDPFFRIYIARIHKCKHGSDTGTYDTEGRFLPQKFEDVFSKYADGGEGLSVRQIVRVLHGQRLLMDPIGWFAAFFEWLATYIMLWPEDGKLRKEDIRGVYDGSIFYTIAAKREIMKRRA